ncbi:MAG TPA: AmmeMemoRadiSam system radical SAM enzyme [Chloroflexi bacterium]|nr:AmmeMemoRadiSam system radical SAM enzyme [Chloroflexota bacterium]
MKSTNFLRETLRKRTTAGGFYTKLTGSKVQCFACAHECTLKPGQFGVCHLRFNQEGTLQVPHGYVAGMGLDPIEKKPFFHFSPGALTMSFGMVGCNFHCSFCQNWVSAQSLNDPTVSFPAQYLTPISSEEVVHAAKRNHASVVVSTYNEPFITMEWAVEIFQKAHEEGMQTAMVSNGFGTQQAIEKLSPHLDALKIDLKSFSDDRYRELGGRLQPVLDTIGWAREAGLWVEIVTLLIPEWNDSKEEIWNLTRFLAGVSRDIPWHVTSFHPDYHMQDRNRTNASSLSLAAELGQEAGLNYVYAGNLPGKVGSLENTYCPHCQKELITRRGFFISHNRITAQGACPACETPIAGYFPPERQNRSLYHSFLV